MGTPIRLRGGDSSHDLFRVLFLEMQIFLNRRQRCVYRRSLDCHGYLMRALGLRGDRFYFAEAISSTMDCVAARGSVAARIGRPTTRKSAPARIACLGDAFRD